MGCCIFSSVTWGLALSASLLGIIVSAGDRSVSDNNIFVVSVTSTASTTVAATSEAFMTAGEATTYVAFPTSSVSSKSSASSVSSASVTTLSVLSEAGASTVSQQSGGGMDTTLIGIAVGVTVLVASGIVIMILAVRRSAATTAAAAAARHPVSRFPRPLRPRFPPARGIPRPYRRRVPLYGNKRGCGMQNKSSKQTARGNHPDRVMISARCLLSPPRSSRFYDNRPVTIHRYPSSYLSSVHRPMTSAYNNFSFVN